MQNLEDILPRARQWLNQGHRVILASVLKTWGSSPRAVGSLMLIRDDGLFEGSVSGGCVEGVVLASALEHAGETHSVLSFDVAQSRAWAVGLACGGRIDVLLWPTITHSTWMTLFDRFTNRLPVTLQLETTQNIITVLEDQSNQPRQGWQSETIISQHFIPTQRLVLIGAVHIAQALAPMAVGAGFDVHIVDPRQAFTQAARFEQNVTIHSCWPQAMNADLLDVQCAVVCLSHDPKIDDPALKMAMDVGAVYIGALGSRKSHAKRVARLLDAGYSEDAIDRIFGPVGLDLGAVTAPEIAVSILAQMIQVRHS